MRIPAEYFVIPRAYQQYSIPMSWGCCCAPNSNYDGRIPNISVDQGEEEHQLWDDQYINANEVYFDMGQQKLGQRTAVKQGQEGFNSTSENRMRNVNIYSTKEENLVMRSHSSLRSRKSSRHAGTASPSSHSHVKSR